ncbi:MAG: hypothetical protein LC130_04035 [Bryobacterales bacterium]|nr:hypothetical protein [Bryobacterales bacterium]
MADVDASGEYLRTDEAEEAVSSLEATAEFLQMTRSDLYRWKWVILALHSAAQGFMVLALRGGTGLLALQDDVAAAWLTAYENEKPYPTEKLDSFLNLYKKVKSDRARLFSHSRSFVPKGTEGRSIRKLNNLRNEFIHFTPKGWSLELAGLPRVCAETLNMIEFLHRESGNILLHDENLIGRIDAAIRSIRRSLGNVI